MPWIPRMSTISIAATAFALRSIPCLPAGIGSTIVQGMAFGTGSAVAHRAVDAVAGPRTVVHEHKDADQSEARPMAAAGAGAGMGGGMGMASQGQVCELQLLRFNQCLAQNNNQMGASDYLLRVPHCLCSPRSLYCSVVQVLLRRAGPVPKR